MGPLQNLDLGRRTRAQAVTRPNVPGRAWPGSGRAARHGLLWVGAAGAMGLSRNRGARRAALRGLGSSALASGAARILGRQVVRHQSPQTHWPPDGTVPRATVSMPVFSGHGASAAAFATAVTLEAPWLGAAVILLTAANAVARVRTGSQLPGDAVLGAALGAGTAAATLRWWPLRDDGPADAGRPRVPVPALDGGHRLVIVVNLSSGSADTAQEELRTALPEAELMVREPGQDLQALLARAVSRARELNGALGVAGGDGTVNAAAKAAAEHGLPLAVFPAGTLNHFAADIGLFTIADTAAAVRNGHGGSVDLGRVARTGGKNENTGYFLNTFSIGIYPELVRTRESLERGLGKWPALALGLVRVLAEADPVEVELDGRRRRLWLLFAGNGRYDPPGFAPSFRRSLDDGSLDVRLVDGSHPFARTRLLAAFLTGTLARSRVYQETSVRSLRIDGLRDTDSYACDGEVDRAAESLLLDKAPHALTVYTP
ncbi:diacylglycerol/lipid kinase family protein [Streptacidiphilus rugosus]|uniref:diacylglycerol/lipid kinase family protein n=1 Tax=Streptacidiphilus rugosus TaxID=405783 RepID=UPI00056CE672|nr:diacylglycerol kinase family protein [Streptacidiphilus rugosus]